jgi:hypothetical protein
LYQSPAGHPLEGTRKDDPNPTDDPTGSLHGDLRAPQIILVNNCGA